MKGSIHFTSTLTQRLTALEKENAELRKDKERLDWLEVNQKSIIHDCESMHDAWVVGLQGERYNTIRQAIDSAAKEGK